MESVIIFYAARRTSYCERSLKRSISRFGIGNAEVSFAVTPEEAGRRIVQGFADTNIVFVVGGLSISGSSGIKETISRALSVSNFDECKKLKNSGGEDGYVIRAGEQFLVLLPDNPEHIEEIMQGAVARYIVLQHI